MRARVGRECALDTAKAGEASVIRRSPCTEVPMARVDERVAREFDARCG